MDSELIEYMREIVPGATAECAGCPAVREVGVMVVRDGKLYHSQECADRSCAVVRKVQPKGVKLDGWDI
jgi:uncharacterized pyridoxamine 5'-phosphate oxidase family protein